MLSYATLPVSHRETHQFEMFVTSASLFCPLIYMASNTVIVLNGCESFQVIRELVMMLAQYGVAPLATSDPWLRFFQ